MGNETERKDKRAKKEKKNKEETPHKKEKAEKKDKRSRCEPEGGAQVNTEERADVNPLVIASPEQKLDEDEQMHKDDAPVDVRTGAERQGEDNETERKDKRAKKEKKNKEEKPHKKEKAEKKDKRSRCEPEEGAQVKTEERADVNP